MISEGPRTRVLVVDDDADLVVAYQAVLEAAGYQVTTACSGDAALGLARTQPPDVLLTDVSMPHMDGFELIDRLRSELGARVPQVVVCSGFEITRSEAMARGAGAFLQKPAGAAAIVQAIEALHQGTQPEPAATVTERGFNERERQRNRLTSELRLREVDMGLAANRARPWLEWLRRYLDCESAGVFLLRPGGVEPLVVVGAQLERRPEPERLHAALTAGVETGTSLVVADMATHPSFRQALGRRADIAFFAGVPLATSDGIRVGALCVADSHARRFDADSLMLMEYLGGRGVSGMFETPGAVPGDMPAEAPLLERVTFETLLNAELRMARRLREAVELTILAPAAGASPVQCAQQVWRTGARARLAIGSMGAGRVGIFVRGVAENASQHVSLCLDTARALGLLEAAGIVDVGVPAALSRHALTEIAEGALSAAASRAAGPKLQRIVVRAEP